MPSRGGGNCATVVGDNERSDSSRKASLLPPRGDDTEDAIVGVLLCVSYKLTQVVKLKRGCCSRDIVTSDKVMSARVPSLSSGNQF